MRLTRAVVIALLSLHGIALTAQAKELALSFDDAPVETSAYFESSRRTQELIRKLKVLNIPPVMIFANPCKGKDRAKTIEQLNQYKTAGHRVENHTCTHPRLDDVGFDVYTKDIATAELALAPFQVGQKFFRFPYLNESKNPKLRDQVRTWLTANKFRNGMVSIDNDDYAYSMKLHEAKKQGREANPETVRELLVEHVVGAANYYDKLAVQTLGRSPKHVLLLHEVDATVLFIEDIVGALRKQGWTIISAEEAFRDPIYNESPSNIWANNGIIAQIATEKTGKKFGYDHYMRTEGEIDRALGIKALKSTP